MKLTLDLPDSASTAFRMGAEELSSHLRRLAAVKSYECGELSQERAAELAGETRHAFLLTLGRFQVSPFQGVTEDLEILGLG